MMPGEKFMRNLLIGDSKIKVKKRKLRRKASAENRGDIGETLRYIRGIRLLWEGERFY